MPSVRAMAAITRGRDLRLRLSPISAIGNLGAGPASPRIRETQDHTQQRGPARPTALASGRAGEIMG